MVLAGALPLAAGRIVFELWRVTGRDALMGVGALVLVLGVGATLWGGRRFVQERRRQRTWDAGSRARAAIGAFLLVACYPIAAWTVIEVIDLSTTYGVEIVNDSSASVTSWELDYGGAAAAYTAPVAPGERVAQRVAIASDGQLRCVIETSDGTRHRILIERYVTKRQGGDARIVLDAEGAPTLYRR